MAKKSKKIDYAAILIQFNDWVKGKDDRPADKELEEAMRHKNMIVLDILRRFQDWRKGRIEIEECPPVRHISMALESAIDVFEGIVDENIS